MITAQRKAKGRWALRALSAPIFVLGLEWIVSGTNKIIGNFVGPFGAYVSSLQAQHVFLPGLSLMVKFPEISARLAIATEMGLGVTLLLSSLFFFLGGNRTWEAIGSTALAASTLVAAGLWLMVGRPPFWPTGAGYASGWSIEFFLISLSAALTVAIALADPGGTIVARVIRRVRGPRLPPR